MTTHEPNAPDPGGSAPKTTGGADPTPRNMDDDSGGATTSNPEQLEQTPGATSGVPRNMDDDSGGAAEGSMLG